MLFAIGDGTFNTGSAFYFTEVVGLSVKDVGLGMTIAGLVGMALAYPAGRMVDIFGPKRMWAFGAFGTACLFAAWPFLHGYGEFVAMLIVGHTIGALGGAGRNAYVLDVMPPKERVETQAFMYSSLNLGFTLGAGISGAALAFLSVEQFRWIPLLTTFVGFYNAFHIIRMPKAAHDLRVSSKEQKIKPDWPGPLRNRGWVAVSFFSGTLWTHQVLLNTVIPLWMVTETDAPRWVLAWLFGTNTVMCIFLPAYASRGVNTLEDALARIRISTMFLAASCALTWMTESTEGLVTVVVVWAGHVMLTFCELALSAGSWSIEAQLMDPRRRGEYGGVSEVFNGLAFSVAPGLFLWLAVDHGGLGWAAIFGIYLLAVIGLHPSVSASHRFLERHHLREGDYEGAEAVGQEPLPDEAPDPVTQSSPVTGNDGVPDRLS
ncbi:MAG: MFS transporter [Nocardioides sp.]